MKSAELEIDLAAYQEQLAILQEDEHARIVGSLGRMVLCQQVLNNPFAEFEARAEVDLDTTRASDIDVLGASKDAVDAAKTATDGFNIDTLAFGDTDITIRHEGGEWLMISRDYTYQGSIAEHLMEPNIEEVEGIEIVTLPLVTQHMIHTMRRRAGIKDVVATDILKELGGQEATKALTYRETEPFNAVRVAIERGRRAASVRHSSDSDWEERHSGRHSQ